MLVNNLLTGHPDGLDNLVIVTPYIHPTTDYQIHEDQTVIQELFELGNVPFFLTHTDPVSHLPTRYLVILKPEVTNLALYVWEHPTALAGNTPRAKDIGKAINNEWKPYLIDTFNYLHFSDVNLSILIIGSYEE